MSEQDVQTHLIPCLDDNYAVLLHDPQTDHTLLVDVPEAAPVKKALEETGWKLTHIFITHHHWDHVQGLPEIKELTGAMVYGPEMSRDKVPAIDQGLDDGDELMIGEQQIYAIGTPGHTLDHLTYWLPKAEIAFTGDTLFSLGCGRVFEGTLRDMWFAVDKIAKLPPETVIFCGHEYTAANAAFCLSIEPENDLLAQRVDEVSKLRSEGNPTLPTTILEERATNTFIRANDPEIKKALGMPDATDWEVFAEIRTRKDNF